MAISTFADTAAFWVIALSALTIPATFSIAQPDVFALPKTVLTVVLAIALAALLALRWISIGRPVHLPRSALAVALVVFVVWNLLAAAFAIDRNQAIFGERLQYQGLITTVAYVVFSLAAWATVRSGRRQNVLLASVAAGATLVATYAILQRAGLDPIWPYLPYGRVFSSIGQANALAAYLVLTVSLSLGVAAAPRMPIRLVTVAAMLLMLVALALTLSRGGYLGVLTAATVFVMVVWSRRRELNLDRRRIGIAAIAVLAVFGLMLAVPDIRSVSQQVTARAATTADLSEGSIKGHLDLWAVGVTIAADHPIVGTGQDTYVLLFGPYRDRVLSPERLAIMRVFRPESPHNVPIAIAQGAGLPAVAAYLAVVALVIWRLLAGLRSIEDWRTLFIAGALLAAIAGHLVTDAFMTAETTGSMLFWTTIGVGAAFTAQPRSGRSTAVS